MGAIPIVQRVEWDLFNELPVVQVQDWSEITIENLAFWAKRYGPSTQGGEARQKLLSHHRHKQPL